MPTKLKIAIVKDWLTSWGGSEAQLLAALQIYPDAQVFTPVFDRQRLPQFTAFNVITPTLPDWLATGRHFEKLALWLPHYFKQLDLKGFDVVLSITSGFAKGVRTPNQPHLCICNTPLRFAWGFGGDRRGWLARFMVPYFRYIDVAGSRDVDLFLANSKNVASRVRQIYGRRSYVLYPPVDIDRFASIRRKKGDYFLTFGRLVSYKRVDILIAAANRLKIPLMVMGDGPQAPALRRLAGPTVTFTGFATDEQIKQALAQARAFLFAAEEDFGIAPVEALAAGVPVIAYQKGGALETISAPKTGLFFKEQTAASLIETLRRFERTTFLATNCRQQAAKFAVDRFQAGLRQAVEKMVQ